MSAVGRYRKKPVVIEAIRIRTERDAEGGAFLDLNTQSIAKASGWMMGHGFRDFKICGNGPFGIAIETLEGVMVASPGDYITRGRGGLFYPCAPDVFEATYEAVSDE